MNHEKITAAVDAVARFAKTTEDVMQSGMNLWRLKGLYESAKGLKKADVKDAIEAYKSLETQSRYEVLAAIKERFGISNEKATEIAETAIEAFDKFRKLRKLIWGEKG